MYSKFAVFFLVFLSVYGGAHYLVGSRLIAFLQPGIWTRSVWLGLALLGTSSIAGAILARTAVPGPWWAEAVVRIGFVWMGFLLLLFFAALASLLLAGIGRLSPAPVGLWMNRGSMVLFALALAGGIAGLVGGARAPRVHEVELRLPGLPAAFDGYRIAHITDTHIGPILRRDWTRSLARSVDDARADLVVHTGDLVDGTVARLGPHVAPLGDILARDGKLFVTGNHEAYSGLLDWAKQARILGYQVLENSHATIVRGSDTLVVAGVTDHHEGRILTDRAPDARKAFERAPHGFRILLAHQPVQAFSAQGLGIGLQLSGHTHGGQIWPFHHLVRLAQPVVSGFGQVGDVPVFVSNGAGYWGPPLRLFAPSEVPVLVLRRG